MIHEVTITTVISYDDRTDETTTEVVMEEEEIIELDEL